MSKLVMLTQGYKALVDDEDYLRLKELMWYADKRSNTTYAVHKRKGCKVIRMHRMVIKVPADLTVHHINKNGLDNRKCNLVITTQQENVRQARKRGYVTSKYKGVSWRADMKKWHARLYVSGNVILLGNFNVENDAAKAYDVAVLKHLGKGYPLNVMGGPD